MTTTMDANSTTGVSQQTAHLFTCLSCCIAFNVAEEQREHYRSDHHRYNMKRRVASLPPISAAVFNQKVLEKRTETAVDISNNRLFTCDVCSKFYTTENAFRSHMNSKKHKESERKSLLANAPQLSPTPDGSIKAPHTGRSSRPTEQVSLQTEFANLTTIDHGSSNGDNDGNDVEKAIDAKINGALPRLSSAHCLFCTDVSSSLEANLTHMSTVHSFFIPEAEYLIDIAGLITYLGEKVVVGNICIYCNSKSREFRTLEATRKHMVDKSHCKIAYDTEDDRLELSDYYDFTSSYQDAPQRRKTKTKDAENDRESADNEWEDVEQDDEPVDEIKDVVSEDGSQDSDDLPENQITYGDSGFELVLPSGARIGHRSMRRYYAQRFVSTTSGKAEDPNSGAALVRRLLADKNSALIPRRGGFGAFGMGTEVIHVRNRGEAKEAGRHIKEYRDQKRREDFKTKVGFIHNSQKHYRDQLLQ